MIPVVVRGRLGGKGASWLSPAHAELLNAQGVAVGAGVVRRSPAGLFAHISGAGAARRAHPVNVLHAYEDPLTTHGPRRGAQLARARQRRPHLERCTGKDD